jgi:division protein CdvB (Snf7/Vps24/ESCRT-III family)
MLRLQKKDREMFQRCVAAQISGDNPHAEIYAGEAAEIRKMARIVLGSKIALERAVLRLETVEQFGDVLMEMTPVIGVVKETREKIDGLIPDVGAELLKVNDLLDDVVSLSRTDHAIDGLRSTDEETKRVLEESSACAEEQIRRQFPEIPHIEDSYALTETEGNSESLMEAESIGALGEDDGYLKPSLLLDFIEEEVQSGGTLNLTKCAEHFRVDRHEVIKAIERLKLEGKIVTP